MTDRQPPEGYHTASPLLFVRDADRAIDFYHRAFGAEEVLRLVTSDGKVVHGEIRIGDSVIMLAEEMHEWGNLSPETLGGSASRVHLYVEDVDALVERAVSAGAKAEIPVSDQFYGDRSGRVSDPFGHTWIISTRIETMSPEEMQQRFEAWMAEMAGTSPEGEES